MISTFRKLPPPIAFRIASRAGPGIASNVVSSSVSTIRPSGRYKISFPFPATIICTSKNVFPSITSRSNPRNVAPSGLSFASAAATAAGRSFSPIIVTTFSAKTANPNEASKKKPFIASQPTIRFMNNSP